MIQRVVIFGGHIQALGLARQVASLTHERENELKNKREVVLLVEDGYSVARFSRAVDRTLICRNGSEEWKVKIEELELPNRGTLLFPTNDEAVEFLCVHYDEYKERFALGVPGPDVIELFNNKRTSYRYATAHNVPCPKCWYPDTIDDVEELSRTLPYPVVVKPAIMYSFHATFGKKAFRCDDAERLMNVYKRIDEARYPLESILIQEFLSGGPKHLYSYGVMAADGKPLASIQANRIRQNPMDFGNSTTYAITCDVPEIEAQSVRLLAQTRYFGLGEVEWMWDERAQQYKFLEINTRAWKWHTLSNMRGFSFIGAMIDYYDGKINIDKHCYAAINTDKDLEINKKAESTVADSNFPVMTPQSTHKQASRLLDDSSRDADTAELSLHDSLQKNVIFDNCEKSEKNIVGWCERLTDWAVVAKEIMHGRMRLTDVVKSYRIPHESAVWSWKDPIPAIMYVLLSPILYVKRH